MIPDEHTQQEARSKYWHLKVPQLRGMLGNRHLSQAEEVMINWVIGEKEVEEQEKEKLEKDEGKLISLEQKRESSHTLITYWRLADWSERSGMLLFFGFLFFLGVGAAQFPYLKEVLNWIKDFAM